MSKKYTRRSASGPSASAGTISRVGNDISWWSPFCIRVTSERTRPVAVLRGQQWGPHSAHVRCTNSISVGPSGTILTTVIMRTTRSKWSCGPDVM
eukprot:9234880-Pyramimonas_sp.AAC.1